MLRAIAIYTYAENETDPDKAFTLTQSAQSTKIRFHADDELETFREKTLPKLAARKLVKDVPESRSVDGEFHYFKRIDDTVMVMVTRQALRSADIVYLFRNIKYAIQGPNGPSLKDIQRNYLNYIGKDDKLTKIQSTLADTKAQMQKNIELEIKNLETTERLEEKSDDLLKNSKKFAKTAHDHNRRCCSI